jgi:23S rRNA G2069 N7-methylase RlmK/C1962 C5-methylase RlmI
MSAASLKIDSQVLMLENRIKKRYKHLEKWARRTGAGAYRLYDRDIPEIPLLLDFYRGRDGICAVSGALYKRPYEKDEHEEELWVNEMKGALSSALRIDAENIFIKLRKRQRVQKQFFEQYQKEEAAPHIMTIEEGALAFKVDLTGYIDTGIFPDLRRLRVLVREESPNKNVLNLFCYTGTFSAYAAHGGAASVDSVDMSAAYLRRATDNFTMNNLKNGTFIRADVFRYLDAAPNKKLYDLIIADPPSFSVSKKMTGDAVHGVFDIKKDYPLLLTKCLRLLHKNGTLYFCVNERSFATTVEDIQNTLAAAQIDIAINEISERIRDEDFRGRRMPRCYKISKIP